MKWLKGVNTRHVVFIHVFRKPQSKLKTYRDLKISKRFERRAFIMAGKYLKFDFESYFEKYNLNGLSLQEKMKTTDT
jgi:hypothetical protein